jgi:hypothetical protein
MTAAAAQPAGRGWGRQLGGGGPPVTLAVKTCHSCTSGEWGWGSSSPRMGSTRPQYSAEKGTSLASVAPTPRHMRPAARRRLPPASSRLGMCRSSRAARPTPPRVASAQQQTPRRAR